ncbi:MAG: SPOR domain-containing protein [Candidatus Omnitrophota bacterium]|nr:SPOR domain-containing protein [Candidatus Omnitrophota bacterium]
MKIFFLASALILIFFNLSYSASLDDAYKDYLSADYEEALIKAKHLQENDEVLYFLGLTYIKIGNYPQARDYLIRLSKNYPRSQLEVQGFVRFADSYFLEGDLIKAKVSYEDIEKKYPSCSYTPLVYLRLAQIAGKEGKWQDKKKYIGKLKEKYAQSVESRFIDDLEESDDFFTIQIGAFSNKKNASMLKQELADRPDIYIVEDKKEGNVLYKVRAGKFASRKDAEKVYIKLIKKGYPARIYP